MWSKFPLNLQGCPPFFSICAQQTKRTKHIVILGLWQKRLKITIVRLWNVVSAREFDWQFYDQRWSKGLKSRPINCEQKNWRRELATYNVVKIVLKLEFEIWEMENFKELIQILRSSEPEWVSFYIICSFYHAIFISSTFSIFNWFCEFKNSLAPFCDYTFGSFYFCQLCLVSESLSRIISHTEFFWGWIH